MARKRLRICPQGHDKDITGGSYWTNKKTDKGTIVRRRICAECVREYQRTHYKPVKS